MYNVEYTFTGTDTAGETASVTVSVPVGEPEGFTDGHQITQQNVGKTSTPRTVVSSLNVTVDGSVYENLEIHGQTTIRADCEFHNCDFIGPKPAMNSNYTIRNIHAQSAVAKFYDCHVTSRAGNTKCVTGYGNGAMEFYRCVIRGGTDGLFIKPEPGFPYHFEDCFIGAVMRAGDDPHADALQIDGGTGGATFLRCNFAGLNYPGADDPTMYDLVLEGAENGNAAVIISQDSTNPMLVANVSFERCHFDGGNYILSIDPPDGFDPENILVKDCTFGLSCQYGPRDIGPGTTWINNTWLIGGPTRHQSQDIVVVAGQQVPGQGG